MKEIKHTPGPWYHDFASGMKNGNPQVVEYFVRRDGDNVSIAADIVDPEKCVPSEANARLIAAAPDLLEQLSRIVAMIDPEGHDVNFDHARDAIAKATGEAA
jgi:hypothetical protein